MKIKEYQAEVLEINNLAKDVRQLKLTCPKDFSFLPGQYISIKVPAKKGLRRSYSICSKPNGGKYFEICFKKVENGPGTTYLFSLNKGDKIEFLGAFGDLPIKSDIKERMIFISSGTGIAPFRGAIHHLLENSFGEEIILLAGYRYEDSILYDNEFKVLQEKYPNFKYCSILSRPKDKEKQGHVQDLIEKYIQKRMCGNFYICGVNEMVKDSLDSLKKKEIFLDKIYARGFG